MAGSLGHVTNDAGQLLTGREILDMLDTGGDVIETIEEMHAIIMILAKRVANAPDMHFRKIPPWEIVQDAREQFYEDRRNQT